MEEYTGLLEQTGEGLEDLNEWIFAELEKKKNEENKEYPEIKEKLLALEGIAQDILSKSSRNLTGQKDDPHFLFVKYLKNQILFHYLFTEKMPSSGFIITSRVLPIVRDLAKARARVGDLSRSLARAKARAEDLTRDLDRNLTMALSRDLDQALAKEQAKALKQALRKAKTLDRALNLAMGLDLAKAEAEDPGSLIAKLKTMGLDLAKAEAEAEDLAEAEDQGSLIAKLKTMDLDQAMDLILARARDLVEANDRAKGLAEELDLILAEDRDLARDQDLDQALIEARDLARDLDLTIAQGLGLDLDIDLNLPNYVPSSLKNSTETDLSQDILLGKSYIELNIQYSSLEKNPTKDPVSLFERVLSSLLEIAKSWDKSDLINHRKTLLDTSLQIIPEYTAQYESSDKNQAEIKKEEPQVKYSPVGLKPRFEKQSEWEMVITMPGDFHRAAEISKLILVFAEGLETIPGVEVELNDIIKGSLIANLRIRFRDLLAKEGTKEILNEAGRLATKGKQAAEDQYLSKPIEEVKKLEAERTKTERETYTEKQAQELRELELEKKRQELIKMRLENIKSVAELIKEGLIPISDLQIDINKVLYLKKVNNEVEVNESWEEEVDQ